MSDYKIPDGFREATWGEWADGTTHSVCRCGVVVCKNQVDDYLRHACIWKAIVKEVAE